MVRHYKSQAQYINLRSKGMIWLLIWIIFKNQSFIDNAWKLFQFSIVIMLQNLTFHTCLQNRKL